MQPQYLTNRLLQSSLLLLVGAVLGALLQAHVFSHAGRAAQGKQTPPAAGEATATIAAASPSPSSGTPTRRTPTPPKSGKHPKTTAPKLPPAPGAKLVAAEPVHEFGNAECGNVVNHTFVLKNLGKETLTIGMVKPDCGCAVASISTKTVPPNGQTNVAVKVNLALKKGPQNRVFLVQSNDPVHPNLPLRMVGNVTSRVQFDRERVDFGSVAADKTTSADLKVTTTGGLTLQIQGTRTSGDNVQAKVEVVEPGKQFRVHITLKAPLPGGAFRGWVHLLTNAKEPDYKVIGIPVLAMVQGQGAAPASKTSGVTKPRHQVEVGKELAIAGPTLDGGQIDVARFRGKPVVVVFWASWCKVCQREMPAVAALYETFKKEGMEVVGVNLDKKTAAAEQYVRDHKLPWPNVHFRSPDGQDARNPLAARYGIGGIPAIFVLDRRGVVVTDHARGAKLREVVARLMEDKALSAP